MPEATELTTVCYRHPRVETAVRCSECGRPICTDCMVFGPVGIRCPDCSGRSTGARQAARTVRTASERVPPGAVTIGLGAVSVGVFVAMIGSGSGWRELSGPIFERGALYGPYVADGEWWRIITGAFLHSGPIHLLFNMLALWWFGRSLEHLLGPGRYLGVYLASALAGSAGALLLAPTTPTVGASGAVFGILGAGLVLERNRVYVFGGSAMAIVVINLVLTFSISGISIGGHLGGLAGGIASMLLLRRFGRSAPLLSRDGLPALAALAGVALVSVAIAYARVRGLA
ncbi:MAG: rhomboid family intramembrane serine protease [Thermoleophilia bacterium]|nr:rhomboid family intramembrane serine protease [Thermoleophilia bacterium]